MCRPVSACFAERRQSPWPASVRTTTTRWPEIILAVLGRARWGELERARQLWTRANEAKLRESEALMTDECVGTMGEETGLKRGQVQETQVVRRAQSTSRKQRQDQAHKHMRV